jgi:hypothetical protein
VRHYMIFYQGIFVIAGNKDWVVFSTISSQTWNYDCAVVLRPYESFYQHLLTLTKVENIDIRKQPQIYKCPLLEIDETGETPFMYVSWFTSKQQIRWKSTFKLSEDEGINSRYQKSDQSGCAAVSELAVRC